MLQEIYMEHGYFLEDLISITKKGRNGAAEIAQMMEDLRTNAPKNIVEKERKKVKDTDNKIKALKKALSDLS